VTLIRPDEVERFEAPEYRHEFHIVPVDESKVSDGCVSFGFHDFVRDCVCHPKIQVQCFGRTLVSHRETVN
jgi:hypothetical protein